MCEITIYCKTCGIRSMDLHPELYICLDCFKKGEKKDMTLAELAQDLEVMFEEGKYEEVERFVASMYGWSQEEMDNGDIVIHNTLESARKALDIFKIGVNGTVTFG